MTAAPRTVLLTRPRQPAEALARRLRQAGGHRVMVCPMTAVRFLEPPLPQEVAALALTSATAVKALVRLSAFARLRTLPVHVIGPATAKAARRAGMSIASEAGGDRARLVTAIAAAAPQGPVLYPCGDPVTGDLPAELAAYGCAVAAVTLYRMEPQPWLTPAARRALDCGSVDWVLLLSAQAARVFGDALAAATIEREKVSIGCLSPAIAAAAGRGWRRIAIAPAPALPKLLTATGLLCDNQID